jgi:hypothetical protein
MSGYCRRPNLLVANSTALLARAIMGAVLGKKEHRAQNSRHNAAL